MKEDKNNHNEGNKVIRDIIEKMLREQRYEVLGYFIEKKTKEEYARERFKKKYNYVPDKTKGGNDPYHGTITDDKGNIIHRFFK